MGLIRIGCYRKGEDFRVVAFYNRSDDSYNWQAIECGGEATSKRRPCDRARMKADEGGSFLTPWRKCAKAQSTRSDGPIGAEEFAHRWATEAAERSPREEAEGGSLKIPEPPSDERG
jgi:hypothetical protein